MPVKRKPWEWERLARMVARQTGGFESVIKAAADIYKDDALEAKDRLKAMEFLSKWTEANPASVRVSVSGPGGKPIQIAHAHLHRIALPDLSKLSDAELDAYTKLQEKLAGPEPLPALPAPRDVIDVEPEK